jgi:hypothetical protein
MHKITLRKGLFIGFISIGLLFGTVSISLASEGDSGHAGMNMGGSTTTQSPPKVNDTQAMQSMNSASEGSHSEAGHEATPGMDPNMEGMSHGEASSPVEQNSGGHGASSSEGHGEAGGGHGESAPSSEGVNWAVIGGFLGINGLTIIIAGILKAAKKIQLEA